MYKGSRSCASCHKKQFHEWSASKHLVNCEDCHGASGEHPLTGKPPLPADARTHELVMYSRYALVTGKMHMPSNTAELCSQCHNAIAGRPAAQPQIVVSQHAGKQQCTACHDPHTPKIVFPSSPDSAQIGVAASGKTASAQCVACHGADGKSVSPEWPNLAGQSRAYLATALEAYRSSTRKAPIMNGIAANLSEADISNVTAYFSGLAWQPSTSVRPASSVESQKVSAEACATCHGDRSASPNPIIPPLAGQNEIYLTGALDAYRAGSRQSDLMSRIAHHLTAADIKQLAAYYAGLHGLMRAPLPQHASPVHPHG